MALIGNRYDLVDTLGKGGMGVVYRAHDRFTNTQVALKQVLISPNLLHFSSRDDSTELRVALATEFQILASLRHPHIISVLDYGFDDDGQPYFTMPLLNNAFTLREACRNLDDSGKISLVIQVLQAMVYLHQHGIVHRDLKPANILVEDQELARVLDFGLAVDLEQAKGMAGTVSYMAPEVIRGGIATPASDLFGVGVILFELLTGEKPFAGNTPYHILQAVLKDEPDWGALSENGNWCDDDEPTFRLHDDDATMMEGAPIIVDEEETAFYQRGVSLPQEPMKPVPYNLQAMKGLLEKLLAKSPKDRYQNATDVIRELCEVNQLPLPAETIEIRQSHLEAAPFLGRDNEVAFLRTAIDAANENGQGRAILIGGESGIGKSRLLEEMRTYALVRGMPVFWGQGVAEGGVPYQLWRNPLRRLVMMVTPETTELPILKTLVPDIEVLLNLEDISPSDVAREQTIDTIKALFQRHQSPMLVILDDLQWSVESLDVLRELTLMIGDLPLVILGAYRSDERQDLPQELPQMEPLMLERLGQKSVEQLCTSMLGEQGRSPDIVQRLMEETEGNVFFLVETLRAVAEEVGRLANIKAIPAQILAGGVQDIIRRRISRVPEWGRDLLQIAAVASRNIDSRILAYLLDGNPDLLADHSLDDWLHSAHSAAVLEVRDEIWRFSHDKLRESLLISFENKAPIHEMIAVAYETVYPDDTSYAAILTDHWAAAGYVDKERHYAMIAGQQNLKLGSLKEALAFFERAQDERADADYQATIQLHLGHVRFAMSDTEIAEKHFSICIELASSIDNQRLVAQAYCELGQLNFQNSDYEHVEANLEKALTLSRAIGDKDTECNALKLQSEFLSFQTHIDTALETVDVALSIAREINNTKREAELLHTKATQMRLLGDLDEAAATFDEALAINTEIGDKRAIAKNLTGMGAIWADRGDPQKALELYQQGYQVARAIGAKYDECLFLRNTGAALAEMRRGREAIDTLLKAMQIAQLIKDVDSEITCLINIGNIYTYLTGELDKASEVIERAIELNSANNDTRRALYIYSLNGTVSMLRGHFDDAIEYHKRAADLSNEIGHKHSEAVDRVILSQTYFVAGHFEEVTHSAQAGVDIASEINSPLWVCYGQTFKGWGLLALDRPEEALSILQSAAEYDFEVMKHEVYVPLGIAYLRNGLTEEAKQAFDEAIISSSNVLEEASDDSEALGALALAYAGLGQTNAARHTYQTILKSAGNPGTIQSAVRGLDELQKAAQHNLSALYDVLTLK